MTWRQRHGVWTSGRWTIRLDVDAHSHVVLYELYDSTRFVRYFESPNYAMQYAERAQP